MKFLILLLAAISSTFAITLNCRYVNNYYNEIGTVYSCIQPTLSNIATAKELTAVSGTHEIGRSSLDVRALSISDQPELTYIPRGIEKIYPNLIALAIFNTNISRIIGDELDVFPKLQYIRLTANKKLERVPGNLFSKTPLLLSISFESNNIKYVGENLLNGLTKARYINFIDNYCTSNRATFKWGSQYIRYDGNLPELFKKNCTDIQPTCDELPIHEVVCNLQDQNKLLFEKNSALEIHIAEVKELVTQIANRLFF